MKIPFVDPETHEPLDHANGALVNPATGEVVAPVVAGLPRFVAPEEDYATSFGWQWNRWEHVRSDSRSQGHRLGETILKRTHFGEFDLQGKTLLECGMGGGDDTEVLLSLPFGEIHSFDISTSVDRAARYLKDERLTMSQASIFEIPYPDACFDFVFCHRVLQHTPDPERALRCICAKVKPGGVLFAHSYKRSRRYMMEFRYKYRWLTKRLPYAWVHRFLDTFGPTLHRVHRAAQRTRATRWLAYSFLPWYGISATSEGGGLAHDALIELEKCVTFDALTPLHDHPMTSERFRRTIESEGFRIVHMHDPKISPLYCTAIRA